ncbi:MAG: tetratricopeptide repeat protein [Planctomycetota bacterium]|jgi:tetratricopeptide (TPR) repeat protein
MKVLTALLLVSISLANGCSKRDTERSAYFKLRGDALAKQGKLREALIQYQKAIEIDPHYSQAHQNMGQVYKELRDIPNAQRSFSLACLTFGQTGRLRSLLEMEPQADFRQETTYDLLLMAIYQADEGKKLLWTDPQRSLGILLVSYDNNGNAIEDSEETLMIMFYEDRKKTGFGVLPDDFLTTSGIAEDKYRCFIRGLWLVEISEVNDALLEMTPSLKLNVDAVLSFENEQFHKTAAFLRKAIKIEKREGAKEEFERWLVAMQPLLGSK